MRIINKIVNIFNKRKEVPSAFFTKDFFTEKNYNIGDYTYGKPTVLYENNEANLFIGKFCSIAAGVTIFLGGNHRTDWVTTYPFNDLEDYFPESNNIIGHPATKGDVVIGNDVWIGRNVTILSGVTIGDGAVIAAESLVSRNVGDYEIWGGNPSKLIKKRFDENIINQLIKLKWWDWDIHLIKENISKLCSNNMELLLKIKNNK